MNPRIVGGWDGTHIWLQWESPDADTKYEVRIRFRSGAVKCDWQPWLPLILPRKNWIVLPVTCPIGTFVQAQVRVKKEGNGEEDGWTSAMAAKFARSVCLFNFSATKKPLYYPKGVRFHCHVDGGVCTYRLKEEIEVEVGESKEIEMEAEASDGRAQLDAPGDFVLRPVFGATITNTEPSRNDLGVTDKDFARVEVAKRDGAFGLAILRPTDVR